MLVQGIRRENISTFLQWAVQFSWGDERRGLQASQSGPSLPADLSVGDADGALADRRGTPLLYTSDSSLSPMCFLCSTYLAQGSWPSSSMMTAMSCTNLAKSCSVIAGNGHGHLKSFTPCESARRLSLYCGCVTTLDTASLTSPVSRGEGWDRDILRAPQDTRNSWEVDTPWTQWAAVTRTAGLHPSNVAPHPRHLLSDL